MKPNTKEQVAAIAKFAGKSKKEVAAKLAEVLETAQIKALSEDNRVAIAVGKVYAQYMKERDAPKATPITFRVEAKEEPTAFTVGKTGKQGFRSAIHAVVVLDEEPFYSVITLWNDANQMNPEMIIGETYTTKAVVNAKGISMNEPAPLEVSNRDLPELASVITDTFTQISVCEREMNLSEDFNDVKLIKGIVSDAWTHTPASGKTMGSLKIMSEDHTDSMVIKFSRNYEQVDYYDVGSVVYVLAQITAATYNDEDGKEIYPCGGWGTLIIPIVGLVKETDENVDMDVDGDFTDIDDVTDDFDAADEDW